MNRHVDHRLSPRGNFPLKAWLYVKDQPPRLTATKNVGRHGVLLETGQEVFGDARVVDIAFTDRTDSVVMHTRGWVVHSTASGTGIMLRDPLLFALYLDHATLRETTAQRPRQTMSHTSR